MEKRMHASGDDATADGPLEQLITALHEAIDDSLRHYITANAVFYAERLFDIRPDYRHLHTLAHCYVQHGELATARRLLQNHQPYLDDDFELTLQKRAMRTASTPFTEGTEKDSPGHWEYRSAKVITSPIQPFCHQELPGSLKDDIPKDIEARWDCQYLLAVLCCRTQQYVQGELALRHLLRISEALDRLERHGCERTNRSRGAGDTPLLTSSGARPIPAFRDQMGAIHYWLGICAKHKHLDSVTDEFLQSVRADPLLIVAFEEYVRSEWQPSAQCLTLYENSELPSESTGRPTAGQSLYGPSETTPSATPRCDSVTANETANWVVDMVGDPRTAFSTVSPYRPGGKGWGERRRLRREAVRQFLKPYAHSLYLLYTFRCTESRELLSDISNFIIPGAVHMDEEIQRSPWRLTNLGLSHFHEGNMQECASVFAKVLEVAPWRLHEPALVYYSTALWQLKAENRLGFLSQLLIEEAPLSAITLCVVANTYSLAHEPQAALTMLQRALQVDPYMAYAYTLRGYELLSLDQKSEADEAFKEAVHTDRNLYIAYAGLGELQFRVEKMDYARQYFRLAMTLNPLPTIMNRFAATFHRRDASHAHLEEALKIYEASIRMHPNNLSGRHQRAEILMRLGRYDKAHTELLDMIRTCPGEAMLYVTLARCSYLLGITDEAVRHYHTAMNLDPRREAFIKGCLEQLAAEQGGSGQSPELRSQ